MAKRELSVLINILSAGVTCAVPAKQLKRKARHIDQFLIIRQWCRFLQKMKPFYGYETALRQISLIPTPGEDKKGILPVR